MQTAVATIGSVCKTYRSRTDVVTVLTDINLEIYRGERVAFVGPNGSGKTTLLRILLGVEQPDSGTVSIAEPSPGFRVAYVPQDYRNALFPWLRLRVNLDLAIGGNEHATTNRAAPTAPSSQPDPYHALSAAFRINLDLDKFPYQLSGGEEQIFLLMRAILSDPTLMVLDEPLSAVDFGRKRSIQNHLGALASENGTTLVFASHDFEEAAMLSDRVVVFGRGTGRLHGIVPIKLPWPRTHGMRDCSTFKDAVETITRAIL